MSRYEIVTRDLTAYSFESSNYADALRVYESNKEQVLDPGSALYGEVLMETKRVRSGFTVEFAANWVIFKPLPVVHKRFTFIIQWLWFSIHCRWNAYDSVKHGKIIKDWLGEEQAN